MLTDRKDMYEKVLVDTNKEMDYLDSKLPVMDIPQVSTYIVPQHEEGRLDLVASSLFSNVKLWWLLAQYNDITDPFNELITGYELKVPSLIDYYKLYYDESKRDDITQDFDKRDI